MLNPSIGHPWETPSRVFCDAAQHVEPSVFALEAIVDERPRHFPNDLLRIPAMPVGDSELSRSAFRRMPVGV
jgi:hypothetical protein